MTELTATTPLKRPATAADYVNLMKPRIMMLVVFTAIAGLAAAHHPQARLERAVWIRRDHFAGQFDEAGVHAVLARLPGQVERVDRDAMAAETGARIERHEAERLGLGRLDHLPDIDPHLVVKHFQFVDQSNVDRSIRVFQNLAGFYVYAMVSTYKCQKGFCADSLISCGLLKVSFVAFQEQHLNFRLRSDIIPNDWGNRKTISNKIVK